MMKADNLISDRVMERGIVRPEAAARGCGDVKEGFESRYVFSGLACYCRRISNLKRSKQSPVLQKRTQATHEFLEPRTP